MRTLSLDLLRGQLDSDLDVRAVGLSLDRRRATRAEALQDARNWVEREALLAQHEGLERELVYAVARLRRLDAIEGEMVRGRFIAADPFVQGTAEVAVRFSLTELVASHTRASRDGARAA